MLQKASSFPLASVKRALGLDLYVPRAAFCLRRSHPWYLSLVKLVVMEVRGFDANVPPRRERARTGGAEVFLDLWGRYADFARTKHLQVRTLSAAGNLRDNHEKAAKRKQRRETERGMKAHKLAR